MMMTRMTMMMMTTMRRMMTAMDRVKQNGSWLERIGCEVRAELVISLLVKAETGMSISRYLEANPDQNADEVVFSTRHTRTF